MMFCDQNQSRAMDRANGPPKEWSGIKTGTRFHAQMVYFFPAEPEPLLLASDPSELSVPSVPSGTKWPLVEATDQHIDKALEIEDDPNIPFFDVFARGYLWNICFVAQLGEWCLVSQFQPSGQDPPDMTLYTDITVIDDTYVATLVEHIGTGTNLAIQGLILMVKDYLLAYTEFEQREIDSRIVGYPIGDVPTDNSRYSVWFAP